MKSRLIMSSNDVSSDHDADIEAVPLTSRMFQRSASSALPSADPSPPELSLEQRRAVGGGRSRGAAVPLLTKDAVAAVLVFLSGWFVPRYMVAHETSLGAKEPPYQVTAAGDVLLDFALNYPLVEPPMIPCTYLMVKTSG
jgi:hypothetical protein